VVVVVGRTSHAIISDTPRVPFIRLSVRPVPTAEGCSELRSLDLSGCCRIKGPGLLALSQTAMLVRPAGTACCVERSTFRSSAPCPALTSALKLHLFDTSSTV